MRLQSRWIQASLAVLATTALASAAALADPLYGPISFEQTTVASQVFNDAFTSPAAGNFVVWVQNGDDGGNKVAAGEIDINGSPVVTTTDLAGSKDLIRKPVSLVAGNNTVAVTLSDDPGSFLTIVILAQGQRPDLTIGRILLPHADSSNLVLDLKNGAHAGRRYYRVVFYNDGGLPVASSARLFLEPRGSLSQTIDTFITNGSWTSGSIEIFYVGRGAGRMFGDVVEKDATTGVESIVPMFEAGSRRLDPAAQAKAGQ